MINDLTDIESMKYLVKYHEKKKELLMQNHVALQIFRGGLMPHIHKAIDMQLNAKSANIAKQRVPPFNLMKRVIDKLSKIYDQKTSRSPTEPNEIASEVLDFYMDSFGGIRSFNTANEYFNLFKYCLWQPVVAKGKPKLRAIPNDRFLPWTHDKSDPSTPEGFLFIMDKKKKADGTDCTEYMAYTDEQIVFFNSDLELLPQPLNPENINTIGRLPFVYVNRSDDELIPTQDTDMVAMTVGMPCIAADLNYAIMYQAFSIVYGIDVDDENLDWGPDTFQRFKSDPNTETTPQIGTIKPAVDIAPTADWIMTQISLWLSTRGIRPGSVGDLNGANFASGVSKIIDEMDTSEDRNKQVGYFQHAEKELWDLMPALQEVWVTNNLIPPDKRPKPWPQGIGIKTNFAEQVPLVSRGSVVDTIKKEMELGLLDRFNAKKRLDPHMTDNEIEEFLASVDEGRTDVDGSGDGEPTEAEPAADPAAPMDVQPDQAPDGAAQEELVDPTITLNGAQVSAMVDIVTAVAQGQIPRASAVQIIMVAFNLKQEQADKVLDQAGQGFTPAQPTGE